MYIHTHIYIYTYKQDKECAQRARKHLEYVMDNYPIVASQVGRIVGKSFASIREIEDNSKVCVNIYMYTYV
jgi:hypothetical protein